MPSRSPAGTDQRGAAPVRMRRRGEDRLVEHVFPIAGEFLLADDARRDRALASARARDHDLLVERDHGGVAERQGRQIELRERLHQPEAGRLVVAEHVARHHAAVIEMQPDRLGLGDQVPDGEHHAVLADQHAVAGALGAERLGRERVARDDRMQPHHRGERLVQVVAVVLRSRLHRGRNLEVGQGWHGLLILSDHRRALYGTCRAPPREGKSAPLRC